MMERPDLGVRDEASFRTARDLIDDVLALAEAAGSDGAAPDDLLRRVVNVQYDALLAAIDLVKSHSELSKVPADRR